MRDEYQRSTGADLEAEFQAALPFPPDLEPGLHRALHHLLDTPGSMVRPRMVYQVATAYDMEAQTARDLAIALEYFHTSSLVFDDLPCMDNATARRGVPCVHVAFGEAHAILAGLALINRAYALAWSAIHRCPAALRVPAMHYLEQRLGVQGLLNGQSLDLNYATLPHDRRTTERIACGKTVSLIRLTLVLPAMLGGATRREAQFLERLSTFWGLGYQMLDDLKDVLQSPHESGKTAARDEHLDRPNIALAVGMQQAISRLKRLITAGDRTLAHLVEHQPRLGFLRSLRNELDLELSRVMENVCIPSGSGSA